MARRKRHHATKRTEKRPVKLLKRFYHSTERRQKRLAKLIRSRGGHV